MLFSFYWWCDKQEKLASVNELTPIQQHGIHNPNIPEVSVCLHQGKHESGLEQGQTYSTQVLRYKQKTKQDIGIWFLSPYTHENNSMFM